MTTTEAFATARISSSHAFRQGRKIQTASMSVNTSSASSPSWRGGFYAKSGPTRARRSGPLRKISDLRSARLKPYIKRRKEWLRGKTCAFPGCQCRRVDLHHSRGRDRFNLMDERFWIALCRRHHNWVGDNPADAAKMGLLDMSGWRHKACLMAAHASLPPHDHQPVA
jgi:hypothetical protein